MLKYFLVLLLTIQVSFAQKNQVTHINWDSEKLTVPVPEGRDRQHGLAAPFAGVHNGVLMVGGGANFPDTPVADGGKKVYHRSLFIYDLEKKSWYPEFQLPANVAYGKSVKTEKGIVCLGGTNGTEDSAKAFVMSWNKESEKPEFTHLPDLPVPMHSFAAAILNKSIYIFGGSQSGSAGNRAFKLDTEEKSWEEIKSYPGKARMQAIAVSQSSDQKKDLIFLFSGHSQNEKESYVSSTYLAYDPEKNSWSEEKEILPKTYKKAISLGGAGGIAAGAHHIIFTGGYNREIFLEAYDRDRLIKQAEKEGKNEIAAKLKAEAVEYLKQSEESFQWNTKVLAFHTVSGTWHVLDDYPHPPPCGAAFVEDKGTFYVINGETMPGIRSPHIYSFSFVKEGKFHTIDYAILFAYLLGMLWLGLYFMKRENGTEDFFKGGGRIPWWAAGISIFATMLSSISFMAIPALTYISDWKYFTMAVTIFLMAPVIIYYYLPFFRKLNITSAYEYLEKRFNVETRILGSLSFIIFMIARVAIVLYLPALALSAVTGISIITCILIIGAVTIIYCVTGGIEAVVWGDVIQGVILVLGALLAIGFLVSNTSGGLEGTLEIAGNRNKMAFLDMTFDLSKPVFWVVLIGGLVNNLTSYSSDQSVIQRYVTTGDDKSAAKSIWLNGILSIPISLILYFIGTALFSFYSDNPQLLDVAMEKNDSIFPTFIVNSLPIGISGLLIAAIFSATMSTLSSNINSAATAYTTDFYCRFKSGVSDHQALKTARFSTVLIGLFGIGFSILLAEMDIKTVFDQFMKVVGIITSGLGGLFFMGIFFKNISGKGALLGLTASYIVLFAVNFGWFKTELHVLNYGVIGLTTCVVTGLLSSFIFPNSKNLSGLCLAKADDDICN